MRILDILKDDRFVASELTGSDKGAVLRELAEILAERFPEVDADRLVDVLWERKKLGSTAIGDGIAIPHGKIPGLSGVIGMFARHPSGVDFESLDGGPTRLFFLLVAPEESVGQHLKALARVSRLLKDGDFRQRLIEAPGRKEIFELIRQEDERL